MTGSEAKEYSHHLKDQSSERARTHPCQALQSLLDVQNHTIIIPFRPPVPRAALAHSEWKRIHKIPPPQKQMVLSKRACPDIHLPGKPSSPRLPQDHIML